MKKKIISILVTITLVGFLGLYLYQNRGIFGEIQEVKLIFILPIALLAIANLYINGLFLKILTIPFNINLKEYFHLSSASTFLNMITPFRGGAGLRAVYMKKMYKLTYTHFLSTLAGNYIIAFLANSTIALLITMYYYWKTGVINVPILILFLIISSSTILLISLPLNIKPTNFVTIHLNKMLKGWEIIKKHKKIIPTLILLIVLNLSTTAVINKIAFASISFEINYLQAFYFATLGILTAFIAITPGALGITEGFYLVVATVLGISPEISLVVALILRAIRTTTFITIGSISNIILMKKLKEKG